MPKTCTACGVTPIEPEVPVPPKGTAAIAPLPEPETCPNCGKEGTMEEVAEVPSGEDEEE